MEIEKIKGIIEAILFAVGRKVEIKTPQKGEKLRFVEMAKKNAEITLENKSKDIWEKCIPADKTPFIIIPRCSSLGINH